jgi:hypothetical protein
MCRIHLSLQFQFLCLWRTFPAARCSYTSLQVCCIVRVQTFLLHLYRTPFQCQSHSSYSYMIVTTFSTYKILFTVNDSSSNTTARRPKSRVLKQNSTTTGHDLDVGLSKKERGPNWTKQEIIYIFNWSKAPRIYGLTTSWGQRELMNPELNKWEKIALVINIGKQDGVQQDGHACKYK